MKRTSFGLGLATWALVSSCVGQVDPGESAEANAMRQADQPSVAPQAPGSRPPSPSDPGAAGVPAAANMPALPGAAKPAVAGGCAPQLDPTPLRRLSRIEYNNTIRDLLSISSHPADGFQEDESFGGFETNSLAPLSTTVGEAYMLRAEQLGADLDLSKISTCDTLNGDACARSFISQFGRRAFRRPLLPGEIEGLLKVFEVGRGGGDFASGARLVVTAILQAPSFLYRPETSAAEKAGQAMIALSGYELATRLSYFLWSSTPSDTLLAAAESGALRSPDRLETEARRLLADPRALDTVKSFSRQWLGLREEPDKDPAAFPLFNTNLWESMKVEADLFVESVFKEHSGSLSAFLTGPHSFVDPPLAKLYGVQQAKKSFEKVMMPLDQRAGILTQAAMLSVRSFADQPSPIHRGKFVRERLFCQIPPPPPPGLAAMPPAPDPTKTTKQRLDSHRNDAACASCHEMMDPLGYAFMNYDAIGRWQTKDGPSAVDATGQITLTPHSNGPFNGAPDLVRKLAASRDVHHCVTTQWVRFALGRPEGTGESCAIDALANKFVTANQDMRELMVAIATSDLFRFRLATP